MNYQTLAILVKNSAEWNIARQFLSQKNKNCKIGGLDSDYPKCVFFYRGVIDGAHEAWCKKRDYQIVPFAYISKQCRENEWQHQIQFLVKWFNLLDPKGQLEALQFLQRVSDESCQLVDVPYQHLLDAMRAGKTIQYRYFDMVKNKPLSDWFDVANPTFSQYEVQSTWYRIKPNPYQEFVDALDTGKTIQVDWNCDNDKKRLRPDEYWIDIWQNSPFILAIRDGSIPPELGSSVFRIKPEIASFKCDIRICTITDKSPDTIFKEMQKILPIQSFQCGVSRDI